MDTLRLVSLLKTKTIPEIELNEALIEIRDMQIKINDLEDDILPKKNARIKELLMKYDKLDTKTKDLDKLLQNAQYEISTKESLIKSLINKIDSHSNLENKRDIGITVEIPIKMGSQNSNRSLSKMNSKKKRVSI